jgi:hypothetical protein
MKGSIEAASPSQSIAHFLIEQSMRGNIAQQQAQFRAIATRYDKTERNSVATLPFLSLLRFCSTDGTP